MDKKKVLDIIAKFRKALETEGIKIERIILYGSWAKGTPQEGSDIDLVVISRDFRDKGYWQRIDILSDAIYQVFEPIEAVGLTPEEWKRGDSTITAFARDGEKVFE